MIRPPVMQELQRTIRVTYNGEGAMRITSVAAEPATIRAQIVEITPGKSFSIQVTIPTGLEVSATKPARITLHTGIQDKPTLVIDIRPAGALTSTDNRTATEQSAELMQKARSPKGQKGALRVLRHKRPSATRKSFQRHELATRGTVRQRSG